MTVKARNQEINRQLDELYQSATEEFLWEYRRAFPNDPAPPSRLNRFGIIDTQRYDAASGLLIICQETRGWDNRDFGEDRLLRECLGAIAREGLFPEARPSALMWYNLGRWLTLIEDPQRDLPRLAREKGSVLPALGKAAFTNLNKVRGGSAPRGAYWKLTYTGAAKRTLQKELEILCPRRVLLCGTQWPFVNLVPEFDRSKTLTMDHPGARKGIAQMLERLRAQL